MSDENENGELPGTEPVAPPEDVTRAITGSAAMVGVMSDLMSGKTPDIDKIRGALVASGVDVDAMVRRLAEQSGLVLPGAAAPSAEAPVNGHGTNGHGHARPPENDERPVPRGGSVVTRRPEMRPAAPPTRAMPRGAAPHQRAPQQPARREPPAQQHPVPLAQALDTAFGRYMNAFRGELPDDLHLGMTISRQGVDIAIFLPQEEGDPGPTILGRVTAHPGQVGTGLMTALAKALHTVETGEIPE